MSMQNLLEMDSFSQPSSLNEKDAEPPRPKPRSRTRVVKMAKSSSSRKIEKDVDEVMSFSSESGNDRKGLLYKSRRDQQEKGTVSTSAFENNAFVTDEEISEGSERSRGSTKSPSKKKGGILKQRKSSEDEDHERGVRPPRKLGKGSSGNLFSAGRSSSLGDSEVENGSPKGKTSKQQRNKQGQNDDNDDNDDTRSDVTYTVENETPREKKATKPPIPPNKRMTRIPKLRDKSQRLESASDRDDVKPESREKRRKGEKSRKKEDHLAVEIEPEETDDKGEESKENVAQDESETVSVSSGAPTKDTVKSRFGKLFRGSSSESKKVSKSVDSTNVTDKESVGATSGTSSAGGKEKEKPSFVYRWKSTFLKGQAKKHENLDEGGETEEGKTTEDNDDKANANTEQRTRRKKTEDTRIFMPEDKNAEEDEEEMDDTSIKSYSSGTDDQDTVIESPKKRKKHGTREGKEDEKRKTEDVKNVDRKVEEDTQTKKSSLGKLAKIWRGKSKSSEKLVRSKDIERGDDNDDDSDIDTGLGKAGGKHIGKPKAIEKTEEIIKAKEIETVKEKSKQSGRSSRKRDDISMTATVSESESDSESVSESEAEDSKKKAPAEPKRRKNVRRPSEVVQLTDSNSGKDLLFGVTIHQSDLLPLDPNVIHPVVKITVMFQNGQYMKRTIATPVKSERGKGNKVEKKRSKKSKSDEIIVDHTENVADSVMPIMSQPCQPRYSIPTFVPTWNELLVFEEPFKKFAVPNEAQDQEKEPILFFEVMDFLPMSNNGNSVSVSGFHGSDVGWYKVAWAFLKPIGANGVVNLNKKVRLQLYKPVKLGRKQKTEGPEVYSWWKSGKREKLSSTLYVTPKGIIPPETRAASLRQLLSMRKEQLTQAILDSQLATKKKRERSFKQSVHDLRDMVNWHRMEGQSCRPPNKLLATLPTSQIESLNIVISGNVHCTKFSPCGRKLAAGLDTDELHVVLVFEVPTWTLLKTLKGHHGIIYDISWKIYDVNDDTSFHYLATASADSTVRLWKMENHDEKTLTLVKVLHHPSYVYCVKFHPTNPSIVATGCFDWIIRIWDFKPEHTEPIHKKSKRGLRKRIAKDEVTPIILLDKHNSFVNCLMFDQGGQHLFSGDGSSCVFKWSSTTVSEKRHWKLERDAKLHPSDIPVNCIDLHPTGNRILVQLRDNFIKVLDVVTFIPLQTFSGLTNERFQIRSCFSPCGNLVLSGSEDSTLCIWDADTGKILQFVTPRNHPHCIVTCVDYHPHDYYIVIGVASAICEPSPILIYQYEAPVRMNYPMLKKSAMKFKSSIDRSRSQSADSMNNNRGQSGPHLPPKRGDSTEKFISIIHKLDTALFLAQQRNKRRNNETKASTCVSTTTPNTELARKQPSDLNSSTFQKHKDDYDENQNESPKKGHVNEIVTSIEKKINSPIHTTPELQYVKRPKGMTTERPRSASSAVREKREKFKKSRDMDEDRNFKSDSELKHDNVLEEDKKKINVEGREEDVGPSQGPLMVKSNSVEQNDDLPKPKPLKRRSKTINSLEGN